MVVYVRRWAVLLGALGVVITGVVFATASAPSAASNSRLPNFRAASSSAPALVSSVLSWRLPVPISRSVVVTLGRKVVVLGGLGQGDVSTAGVFTIDPGRGSVVRSGALNLAVHDAGGAALGSKAIVFGGGSATTVSLVQSFSGGVTASIGHLPVGRSDLAGVAVGSTDYIVGGFDGARLDPDILATTDGVNYATVGTLVQPVRYPATVALGGSIFVIGGALATTEGTVAGQQTSAIQRFDPKSGSTAVIGHLPVVLSHAMALVLGGRIYVVGGRSGTLLSSRIWLIDPSSGHVTSVGTLVAARSDAGVAVVGGEGYLIGGETTGPLAPLSSIERLRIAH